MSEQLLQENGGTIQDETGDVLTRPDVLGEVDERDSNISASLSSIQDTYYASNGKYLQVITGCTNISGDTTDLSSLGGMSEVQVTVHTGPNGEGYTKYCRKTIDGVVWVKASGVGAHSENFDWKIQVTPT